MREPTQKMVFECRIPVISDDWYRYEGMTRAKARYRCLKAAWDAGYDFFEVYDSTFGEYNRHKFSFGHVEVRKVSV